MCELMLDGAFVAFWAFAYALRYWYWLAIPAAFYLGLLAR